jgi:CubicO group peptidase (beta-lactamase class C family)
MVYENITGQSFLDAYTKVFQEGLGMTSTFADHPPADIDAIIPYNDTYAIFSYSLGLQWP